MKTAIAAIALAAVAVAAPMRAAQAGTDVVIRVDTPEFGIRIGTPRPIFAPPPVYVPPQPVYVPPQPIYVPPQPVYVAPRPVYIPPPVVYVPRVVIPAPRAYPVVRKYRYGPGPRHFDRFERGRFRPDRDGHRH